MENRARFVICILALVMLTLNLSIKAQFADPLFTLTFGVVTLLFTWNFGCNLARSPKFREDVLLYQGADLHRDGFVSAMCSPTYNFAFWTVGACGGCFVGYNLSVFYSACLLLPFDLSFAICVDCAACCLAWIVLQFFENQVCLREICIKAYAQTEPYWTPKIILRSQIVTFCIAEFAGLLASLYLVFFQLLYTGLYRLFYDNTNTLVMMVLGYCTLQILVAITRKCLEYRKAGQSKLEEAPTIDV